jgi:transposase
MIYDIFVIMKTDARAVDHKTLTELRKRAIAQVQAGGSPTTVARVLGVNPRTVFRWLSLYRHGGLGNLEASKRGGRPPKLDGPAMKWLYDTIASKNPLQLRFTFALWTSAMVVTLIRDKLGIKLSRSSVCRLLNQLGLSAQRPLWRAYQQDPEAVRKWLKEEYPIIQRKSRRIGAQIYFADEAGVRSDFHSGTTWGVRGRTPIVSSTGSRFGANIISAVSPRGDMRFMLTKSRVNAKVFIDFLRRLLVNASGPIFLIVDGHPTHKARSVTKFVDSQEGKLQLFFLPPYSPELNPDEFVWNDLKNNCIGRKQVNSPNQLRKLILGHMRRLQKLPDLITSFFRAPTTKYALS